MTKRLKSTKAFYQSSTLQGIVLMAIVAVLKKFGIDAELAQDMGPVVTDFLFAMGALWATRGRLKAKQPLSLKGD